MAKAQMGKPWLSAYSCKSSSRNAGSSYTCRSAGFLASVVCSTILAVPRRRSQDSSLQFDSSICGAKLLVQIVFHVPARQ